jgi:regulator of protease activity HflC (stomatin/prohibitin superfamily)
MNDTFSTVLAIAIPLFLFLVSGLRQVQQGTVAVVTRFGQYRRVLGPGLRWIVPIIERIQTRVSIQNRSVELEFQAVTADQANVYFKAMLLYSVLNEREETIKAVAFKFISERDFMQALVRTVEGSIRAFVATQKQAEILSLRREIVENVKAQVDHALEDWGFHLLDLQINDITFDPAILESMSRVVASNNLKAAAENEGMALLITKTRAAEADGRAIKIAAEAEREAARLRGEGLALFREQVAHGLRQAAEEMRQGQLDSSLLLLTLWVDALKSVAESGKGATLFFDSSLNGLETTMRQLMALQQKQNS